MTGKRKLWISITAVLCVFSLLASILLVFADEYVPSPAPEYAPAYTPAPAVTGQPFTQPGNGEVEDHVSDGTGSKEFYTVQTRNGNTFYLVIDKDRLDDNAYLLSQVDEADLMEFVKDAEPAETPAVVLEETPVPVTEEEEEDGGGHWGWTLLIFLVIIGAVLLWYFRWYAPREQETAVSPSEGMETVPEEPMGVPEDFPEEPVTVPEEGGDDHGSR